MHSRFQPVDETCRLLCETNAHKSIECKGSVANPGVAIIPISAAADTFRQATGWRRNNRAGGLVGQKFEHQRGAVDGLAPTSGVGAFRNPAPPVANGALEQALSLSVRQTVAATGVRRDLMEQKRCGLGIVQSEFRGDFSCWVNFERHLCRERDGQIPGVEDHSLIAPRYAMLVAGIVERRLA